LSPSAIIAKVDADSKFHPLVLGKIGIVAIKRPLDRHCGAHGLDCAAELRNHAVAGGSENAARVFAYEIGYRATVCVQGPQGRFLVRCHEAAVASNIRRKDCSQTPCDRWWDVHAQRRTPRQISLADGRRG
jgi:hypothetical protein